MGAQNRRREKSRRFGAKTITELKAALQRRKPERTQTEQRKRERMLEKEGQVQGHGLKRKQ